MGTHRLILIGLASAILLHTLPAPAQADGERANRADAERYAQRESETPRLGEFKGGGCWDPGPWILLLIPLALVVLPFFLLYKGGEALVELFAPAPPPSTPYKPKPKPPAPAPARPSVATCG